MAVTQSRFTTRSAGPFSPSTTFSLPLVATFHAVAARGSRAPFTQWVGRCSNPRPLVFSQVLHHLSYRPNKKSPMSLRHRAFGIRRPSFGLVGA